MTVISILTIAGYPKLVNYFVKSVSQTALLSNAKRNFREFSDLKHLTKGALFNLGLSDFLI